MAKFIYYPLGNADSAFITTDTNKRFVFDFGAMRNPDDEDDKRIDLPQSLKDDIGWPECKTIDVLAITHGDNDHIKGISDNFWLKHASKYQGDDRIKFNEMWVPAALIVEEGSKDETRIIRAEARHRFLNKDGIRVFSRPGHLKDWLEAQGKKLEDYQHLITDAGQLVPNLTLDKDGIEFFVHSPFAHRTEDGLLDRNQNCLVMQAVVRSNGCDTKVLITADSVASEWEKMVTITRAHKNDHRLAWDVFTVPHHCSYLSMAEEKGKQKTQPTPEFEWLLSQGSKRSIMVSKSWSIPSETTDQPPHIETYRRYKETADALEAELVVTMEHPTKSNPKRLIVEIGSNGPTLKKAIITSGVSAVTTRSPRVG
jgi:ribonuclease BN (tRNA processing enzyme)